MDNLDEIKFKQSIPGWLIKIDNSGRTEFQEGDRYVDELQAWKDLGNTIEPQFTAEEFTKKEEDGAIQALETTKLICIKYLDESEIHVTNDPPYPDDVQIWKDKRDEWRTILKSGKDQGIPGKPFK